ncbi:MAG: PilZ domain-containing protein [Candidatus Anammoxibacter sp.]
MIDNKRISARVKVDIKIGFEFVKWNERRLNRCKETFITSAVDISSQGVGLSTMPDIRERILKQLHTGTRKIRLIFTLNKDSIPIKTFARLVWNRELSNDGLGEKRYGFEFIDIPMADFSELKSFVETAVN